MQKTPLSKFLLAYQGLRRNSILMENSCCASCERERGEEIARLLGQCAKL